MQNVLNVDYKVKLKIHRNLSMILNGEKMTILKLQLY